MSTLTVDPGTLPPQWTRRTQRIDQVLDSALHKQIVGAVFLVSQHGKPVYARACGLADREQGRPMTQDTLFRYSSLTKPLVTAAALALVAQGTLDLQSPITRWLPSFRPRLPNGQEPTITLHHLLTHTAGLSYPWLEPRDGPYHQAGIADGIAPSSLSLTQNVQRISTVPLSFAPGTSWNYSVALDVTGAILERATGQPLPAVIERLITAPLDMRDTAFKVVDPARLAVPYADASPVPVRMGELHEIPLELSPLRYSPARATDPGAFPSGGAGMIGSALDFLRFLEAIRKGGSPILPGAQAAQMLSNQSGEVSVYLRGPGWGFSYGGALLKDPAAAQSPQSAGTWTWGGVYGHSWYVDPAQALTVVLLTNTAIAGMNGPITSALCEAVYS